MLNKLMMMRRDIRVTKLTTATEKSALHSTVAAVERKSPPKRKPQAKPKPKSKPKPTPKPKPKSKKAKPTPKPKQKGPAQAATNQKNTEQTKWNELVEPFENPNEKLQFTEFAGVDRLAATSVETPIDAFKLFFTDAILL